MSVTQDQVVDYIKNLKLSQVKALIEVLESELGETPLALRKPKTVILSSKLHHVVDLVDSVIDISE